MITEENALFQLGFYVRVRTNVAKKGLSPHCCFSSKDDFHISHGKIRQRNSRSEYCMGRCEMRKSSVQFKDGKV